MKRVLYDTNVLLDVLLERKPHWAESARALDAAAEQKVEGYLSGHAVSTIAYVLQRELGRSRSRLLLSHLLANLQVAPVTDRGVRRALGLAFEDIDDAICHAAAEEARVDLIVTRNLRDFRSSTIPVLEPAMLVL